MIQIMKNFCSKAQASRYYSHFQSTLSKNSGDKSDVALAADISHYQLLSHEWGTDIDIDYILTRASVSVTLITSRNNLLLIILCILQIAIGSLCLVIPRSAHINTI